MYFNVLTLALISSLMLSIFIVLQRKKVGNNSDDIDNKDSCGVRLSKKDASLNFFLGFVSSCRLPPESSRLLFNEHSHSSKIYISNNGEGEFHFEIRLPPCEES